MNYSSDTRYYLGFNLVSGIGPIRLARLIEYSGSVEAAWNATFGDLAAAGMDAKSSATLLAARAKLDLDAELERTIAAGVRLVTIADKDYPSLLAQAPYPPPLLYVRGILDSADDWALAIVGTRSPTSYGKEVTYRLATDLANSGITIVSGLALGIDSIAHRAALEAGGRTIAVLGCGVDVPYPVRNWQLAERIITQGALVSEFPLGTKPAPTNFPPRNRIISGLSLGTLVTEAGFKSGALITVDFALEQGRDVFAVPGPIFSKTSFGANQLIRDGAGLITKATDMLEALNLGVALAQQEVRAELPDDPTEAALLALISYEPQHADVLGRAARMPAPEVAATLAMLELKGYVRQVGNMEYVLAR
ncbi:MAG: DNA-processing protein DprA [Chloroflexales bacterium]|nr:DNA-processing protein DprA [Chloroflexales bacterium]